MSNELLTKEEIHQLHDDAYKYNQETRENAQNDLVFYYITQWDDQCIEDSDLAYKGTYDKMKQLGRKIMAELNNNRIQVDFIPSDENSESSAEFLDQLYRSIDLKNASIEAYTHAKQEAVVCGFGAYKMHTEYASKFTADTNQNITRSFIPEANSRVFFDPNDMTVDKRDSEYCSVLTGYTERAYRKLVSKLTKTPIDEVTVTNFAPPLKDLTFNWNYNDLYFVTEFYHRTEVDDRILTYMDEFGQQVFYSEMDIENSDSDPESDGYELVAEKEVTRFVVTQYIVSGTEILSTQVLATQYIPIIPIYGERAIVDSCEIYSGMVRIAKDPQRLRNFQLSYLADIVQRSPRQKPIFFAEQIEGLESMYEQDGPNNNYPYYLMKRTVGGGQELPLGPVGFMPAAEAPPALLTSIQLTNDAMGDVADAGLPQNIADPDLSGKAVYALQAQMDKQNAVYQEGVKFSKRRDGLIFADLASRTYDAPRKVDGMTKNNQRVKLDVMKQDFDDQGNMITLNDLRSSEFDVTSTIGMSYDSQKQQTKESIENMIAQLPVGDPIRNLLMLKLVEMMDGADFEDLREYANNQLLLQGIRKPETPEDEQILAQAQQSQDNNPQAILALEEAEARRKEGQAAMQNEVNDASKLNIDMYKAETERQRLKIDAAQAGVKIQNTQADTAGKMIDNSLKVSNKSARNLSGEI